MDEQNEYKVTRDDFNALPYQVIVEEITRLRTACSRKERDSIREFLMKMFYSSRSY